MKIHLAIATFGALTFLAITVLGGGVLAETQASKSYAQQKVVYQNNGMGKETEAYLQGLLRNLKNHVEAVGAGRIDIRVVNHGKGIILLQSAAMEPEIAAKIDELRAKGVRFLVCRNTLKRHNIDYHDLYGVTEEDLVPSGMAEIVRLQQEGFVYVHP